MTTAIGSTTSSVASAASTATTATDLGLDSDAFLQLFIAQLQYQDPLNPQDATEMMSQLAQLTQVEQAYKTTTALSELLTAQNNNLAMSAVSFIGGTVTAPGTQTYFDGTNAASLQYTMPVATSTATLTISDVNGKAVRIVDLGAQSSGTATYAWDGTDGQGTLLEAGKYNFAVSGTDASGTKQTATTYTVGIADGVKFDNGTAYVTIGPISVLYSDITSVSVS